MPKFSRPAGMGRPSAGGGGSNDVYINAFRDAFTTTRFLFENPLLTARDTWEHYDPRLRLPNAKSDGASYPCVLFLPEFSTCVGCTQPVQDDFVTGRKDQRATNDVGWWTRLASQRFILPALRLLEDGREFIGFRKFSGELRDTLNTAWENSGSLTNRDYEIARTGSGIDTKYTARPVGDAFPRMHTDALRSLYLDVEDGITLHKIVNGKRIPDQSNPRFQEAWDAWNKGVAQIGIPDVDALLGEKYAVALAAYNLSDEELQRRQNHVDEVQARIAAAVAPEGGSRPAGGSSVRVPVVSAQPPAQAPGQVAQPSAHAPADDPGEMARHTAALDAAGVPYPPGSSLAQLQSMAAVFGVSIPEPAAPLENTVGVSPADILFDQLFVALTVANVPIPEGSGLSQLTALAQAFGITVSDEPAGAAADGKPSFESMAASELREWLSARNIPWTTAEPRSVLIEKAEAGF